LENYGNTNSNQSQNLNFDIYINTNVGWWMSGCKALPICSCNDRQSDT